MRAALGLAARGLGNVWPNPAVGCILINDGRIVGRGWTQPGGRPHAETEALGRAGLAARGAAAYVTFEPCAHHGETSPCAEALREAGIARTMIALEDPDPRVSGQGIARLREAGVDVTLGLCADEARELNAGFLSRITRQRPLVMLKAATTLDGCIAVSTGESQWITSSAARDRSHLLRACHDAVMIGVGTAVADDPELTCRLPGLGGRSPHRILVDSRLRTPLTNKLIATASQFPTWVIHLDTVTEARKTAFAECGVRMLPVAAEGEHPNMRLAFEELSRHGFTRVLVEGGSGLGAALLRAGLVDRLAWFRSPRVIGGDGLPVAAAFGVERLDDAPLFRRLAVEAIGNDLLETYALEA